MNRRAHRSITRGARAHDGAFGWFALFVRWVVPATACLFLMAYPGNSEAVDGAVTNAGSSTAIQAQKPSDPAAAAGTTNLVNVLDDKYRLAIGDQLSFRILEDEDDPKLIVVTESGDLEVPYIGRYPAVGKTCKKLAQELKVALEKDYYVQATVIIAVDSKPKSRGKVYLAGAITAPGSQDISGDEVLTVSRAVLRAGGLTSFADGKDVKLTRSVGPGPGDQKTMIVNVSHILEQGKTDEDVALQPGDLIFVPERMIRF